MLKLCLLSYNLCVFYKVKRASFSFSIKWKQHSGVLLLKGSGSTHRQAIAPEWLNVDAFNLDGTVYNIRIYLEEKIDLKIAIFLKKDKTSLSVKVGIDYRKNKISISKQRGDY